MPEYQFTKRSPGCSQCGREFQIGEEYHSALMVEELAGAPAKSIEELEAEAEAGAGAESANAQEQDCSGRDEKPSAGAGRTEEGAAAENEQKRPEDPSSGQGADGLPFRRLDFCSGCWSPEGTADFFSFWKSTVPDRQEEQKPLAKRIDTDTIYDMFRRLEGHAEPSQQKFRFILALMLMRKKRLKFSKVVDSPHGEHLVLDDKDEDVTHKVLDPGLDEEEVDSLRSQIDRLLGGPGDADPDQDPADQSGGEDAAGGAAAEGAGETTGDS